MSSDRILIVNDSNITGQDLSLNLKKLNYDIAGLISSRESDVENILSLNPGLIIFEINLKAKTDLLRIAEELKKSIIVPFVFITSYEDKLIIERLKNVKPDTFLIKPFEINELDSTLRNTFFKYETENKLREKEYELQNYKDIVELSPVGIFQAELNGNLVTVNNTLIDILGYSKEDLINKNLNELYFDDGTEFDFLSPFLIKAERSYEVRWKKNDGEPLWVQLNLKNVSSPEGEPLYYLGFVNDIDDKKKIKIGLAEVQARFHHTLSGNKIGLWDWYLKSDVFNISQEWKNHLGYSYESSTISFNSWKKLIHPDDRKKTVKKLNEFIKGKQNDYEAEYRMQHKDGNYLWFLDRATLIRDAAGKPERVLGSNLDISERKKIEKELSTSQARFNKFFESSPVGFCIINKDLEYVKINDTLTHFYGTSPEDHIGKKVINVFPRETEIESILLRVINRKEAFFNMQKLAGKKGNEKDLLVSYFPLPGDEIGNIVLDITSRVKAEAALKESEEKFRTIYELSPMGIAVLDLKGNYHRANQSFQKILGYTEEEIKKLNFKELVSPEDLESITNFKELISSELNKSHSEIRYKRKDGLIVWTVSTLSAIHDQKENELQVINMIVDISGRKQAELELREKEKYYRALFENSSDLKIIIDKEGQIFYWSRSVEKKLGFEKDDLLGKKVTDFIPQNDVLKILKNIRKKRDKPEIVYPIETKITDKTGNIRYLKGLLNDLTNDPTIKGIILNLRDVTEEKMAESIIRESEEKFRQLAENINDIFYISSPDLNTLYYLSPRFKDLWGIDTEMVLKNPQKLVEFIHPDDKASVAKLMEELKVSGKLDIEHRIIRPDKSIRWIRWRAFPIKDDKGNLYKIAGVEEDITEKKYWEDQVLKLSIAVKQSPVIIMITDVKGSIEYVNPKFLHVTGYSFDEVIGKNPGILNSGYIEKDEYTELWETIIRGHEWQGEFRNKKKNGDLFWVSASISAIIDEQGKISHYLAIEEDITRWKTYEKQLIIAKETAEKSNKLKSEFLAQMSHEIRTPLNNILTYTSLLEEELEDKLPKGLESTFYVIGRSAQRLIRTIDLILNLAKIQTGNFEFEFERIDMDDDILLDIILEFYTRAKEKNIEIKYECKAENKIINGDSNTLGQIFVNLIENSLKYSNSGEIKVTLYNEKGKVCVDVADTGIGISKDFLPRLFEPFAQEDSSTTRNYEGTGLGLTLVKNYIEINKAEISVKSKKGKGTVFTVKFDQAGDNT